MSKLSALKSMTLNSKFIQSIKKIALIYKIATRNPENHITVQYTEVKDAAFKDRTPPHVGTSKIVL